MPTFSLAAVLQTVLALGLLNVWLLRSSSPTAYRGGNAKSLKEEFATYGLPAWAFYVVGGMKIGCAAMFLVGLWVPALVLPAASALTALMLGAVAMHVKVKDPFSRACPALAMLVLTTSLIGLALT